MRQDQVLPPRWVERVLRWVVGPGLVASSMVGDACEEYLTINAQRGRGRANLWYVRHVVTLLVRYRTGFRRTVPTVSTHTAVRYATLRGVLGDLRNGTRILVQHPGLSTIAVVTFTLGVAAPATMFSITAGILGELPFDRPDQIMSIEKNNPPRDYFDMPVSLEDYLAWREQQTSFAYVGAYDRDIFQVSGLDDRFPVRYEGAIVTPSVFPLLGVQPILGRAFSTADAEAGAPVVIVSDRIWSDLFDRRADVLGQSLRLNGQQRTIVGVMSDDFEFPRRELLWIPMEASPVSDVPPFHVFGRLRATTSLETAQEEFSLIASRLAASRPDTHAGTTIALRPFARAALGPDSDNGILMLYAMTMTMAFVLLIGCVNVANLLLVRAISRRRELAVRMALGAGRSRVVLSTLAECLVIASLGGLGGVVLTTIIVGQFARRVEPIINFWWVDVTVDGAVVLFCVGLVALATVLAGVTPALRAANVDLRSTIQDGVRTTSGRESNRLTFVMVTGELALACALLILSTLMVKGVVGLVDQNRTFGVTTIATGRVDAREFDYPTAESRRELWMRMEERLGALPDVEAVSLTTQLPGVGALRRRLVVEGEDSERQPWAQWMDVSPTFFEMFDVQVQLGRPILPTDRDGTPRIAVVTSTFGDTFFGRADPVGRRFRAIGEPEDRWIEIVGVVSDRGEFSRDGKELPGVYLALHQSAATTVTIAVLARGGAGLDVVAPVRSAIAAIDEDLPMYEIGTLAEKVSEESVVERMFGLLFGVFGGIALLMAVIGLYGVISFVVGRRRYELGIRKALGAPDGAMVWSVGRSALLSLGTGTIVGLALALLIAPALGEALFGVSPTDPAVYIVVPVILGAAALTAALIPSLRATRLNPVEVLRS